MGAKHPNGLVFQISDVQPDKFATAVLMGKMKTRWAMRSQSRTSYVAVIHLFLLSSFYVILYMVFNIWF